MAARVGFGDITAATAEQTAEHPSAAESVQAVAVERGCFSQATQAVTAAMLMPHYFIKRRDTHGN